MKSPLNFFAVRSFLWRLGRKLYMWSRRETSGRLETNGEQWLVRNALAAADPRKAAIFLDIGGHRGLWSACVEALLGAQKITGHVHAFEPASATFSYLSEKFKGSDLVSVSRIAMSDCSGEAAFFVVGELAGTNSLVGGTNGATVETVKTACVDDFFKMESIEHVLFVKSDAEGHDFRVLQGGVESLRAGRIDVWQFEYNHRWIGERAFLKDVFDFIGDKPYLLGKIHQNGVEIYDAWHPEMERFFESNYVLIRKGSGLEALCTRVHFNRRNVLAPVLA